MPEKKKLNYPKTILTGFGFLATSIAWAIYDPYITKILNKILSESTFISELSQKLGSVIPILRDLAEAQGEDIAMGAGFTLVPLFIGIIMTFDNIFGVIFQPTFGKLSDTCHSRLGKRRPFIVACAPVSAVLFTLIPIVALNVQGEAKLPLTMLTVILFVFSMSLWRAPVVALMPDLTPPELRSEGNAVINLMGGVGSAVGMVAGTAAIALCTLFTSYTKEQIQADETISFPFVFLIGSIVMIVGMLVLLFFVKEQDTSIKVKGAANQYADNKAKKKAAKAEAKARKAELKAIKLSKSEKKSLFFMLGTLFFLFCGTNAITTFFSLFAQEILHMLTSEATIIMLIFAVCSGAAAIPAGKMGKKFGRKKTIIAGLSVFLAAFIVFFSVFVVMLTAKDLSINKYVTVNNAYTTVSGKINDFNALRTSEAKAIEEDIKKATDKKIELDVEVLEMEKYIEYRTALEKGENVNDYTIYAKFDEYFATSDAMNVFIKENDIKKALKVDEYYKYKKAMNEATGLSDVFVGEKTIQEVLSAEEYNKYKASIADKDALADISYVDFYKEFSKYDVPENAVTSYESVIKVATTQLGLNKNATYAEAIRVISDSVTDITNILRILIYPVLILGGAANMFITVNTLPLVLDIGGIEKVGTFTGYYYTATFSAQIASPIVYGFIRMFAGTYMSLFYYSPIMFALSILLILFVKHGEAIPDDIVKKIKEEAD